MLLLGATLSLGLEEFAPQFDHFSPDFRMLLPDRRGYGRSRPPDRDFPRNFYQRDAEDLAALLRHLDVEPASVLGWSDA
jgi:valacyclovir hydrolase